VTVYEANDAPRDSAGAFLNLAPNGLNAFEALGVSGADLIGFRNDRLSFQSDNGRVLAETSVGGVTIMRGALSRFVREAAVRAGVTIEHGKALTSVEETGEHVVARFADGSSHAGDLLIGADGVHSRTRSSWFPNAAAPTYTGVLNLGGVVHTDLESTGRAMRMVFGRRAFFGYAVRPGGDTYWFSNYLQATEPARKSLETVNGAEFRERLLELHRDDPPEVTRILRAVEGEIGAYAVYDIASLPEWRRGRICLIGDAAHAVGPHVGQGTSLALEDAFVLGRCLRNSADPAMAFATFERLRRDRAERVFKYSRQTAKQKLPSGWLGRKIRDLVLPTFLRKGADAVRWMYDYSMDWEERVA
jgi:2-polyprenyl-6-methoxyphenol hydroxylase-like FAD-dependent oxidoreductase